MGVKLNPYLGFNGLAREALGFYQGALGGEVRIVTYAETGGDHAAELTDRVFHGELVTDQGIVLMAGDAGQTDPPKGFAIALSGDDDRWLRAAWDGLSVDGTVLQPLGPAPWGDTYGMLVDQFGVTWMIDIGTDAT